MKLYQTHCKRCDKPLTTAPAIHPALAPLRAELGGICEKRITPDERRRIEYAILDVAVFGKIKEMTP